MFERDPNAVFEADLAAVADPERRAEWRHYLDYHARRYATLTAVAAELLAGAPAPRVLDVGPMFEVGLLRDAGATVDTLGFPHPLFPPRDGERHVELDLNDPGRDGDGSYDLVVMAEVIEHLPSSPVAVLRHVATWLRPGGALLLQTPNAVALHKRLRMLAGRNPLEPIRADASNPGHFHEYTLGELRDAAAGAGLELGGWRTENYFGAGPAARAYAALGRTLPPRLRHGITIWMRRPARAPGPPRS
jgi:SAM-dependent methyltransferase